MNPIFIYNMGKVGSVSLQTALAEVKVPMIHAHWLTDGEYTTRKTVEFVDELQRRTRRWKVITLVRDPLERNISAFFRDIDKYHTGNNLVRSFVDNYNHSWPSHWFFEFRKILDISLSSFDYFPYERGYEIYNYRNLDLLVIRTENLTQRGSLALEKFLGVTVSIPHENKSKDGRILEFRERARLPLDNISKVYYNTVYARSFYSPHERKLAMETWT